VLRLTRTRRKKNDGFIKPAFSSVQSRMKQQWQRPSLLFSSGSCEQPAAEEKRLPQRLSLIVAAAGAVLCSNGRCSSAGWGGSEPVDEHHFSPTRVSLLPLHTIVFTHPSYLRSAFPTLFVDWSMPGQDGTAMWWSRGGRVRFPCQARL